MEGTATVPGTATATTTAAKTITGSAKGRLPMNGEAPVRSGSRSRSPARKRLSMERSREYDHSRSVRDRSHERDHRRDRSIDRERDRRSRRDRDRSLDHHDRHREGDRDRYRGRDGDGDRGHGRDRDRDRERDRRDRRSERYDRHHDRPEYRRPPGPLSDIEQLFEADRFIDGGLDRDLTVVLTNLPFVDCREIATREIHNAISRGDTRVRHVHPVGRRCGACFVVMEDRRSYAAVVAMRTMYFFNRNVNIYALERPYTVRFYKLPMVFDVENVAYDLRRDYGIDGLTLTVPMQEQAFFEVADLNTVVRLLALDGYNHSGSGRQIAVQYVTSRGSRRHSQWTGRGGVVGSLTVAEGAGMSRIPIVGVMIAGVETITERKKKIQGSPKEA